MISDVHKGVFVQIPKNAGSSIVKYLSKHDFYRITLSNNDSKWNDGEYKMGTARRLQQLHGEIWPNYFKFAIVRNPWDRMISSWMWLTKTGKIGRMNFKQFLYEYPFKSPGADWHSMPQYDHVYKNGCSMVDFIGRFENLNDDFGKICSKMGIPHNTLPHEKKTKHKPYWAYYDKTMRQRCKAIFRKDIETFKYKFK